MTRDIFFEKFNNVIKLCGECHALAWNTANENLAITYNSLNDMTDQIKTFLNTNIELNNIYVGLCLKSKHLIFPLIVSLWKNNQGPVLVCNDNIDAMSDKLGIKYVISDSQLDSTKCVLKTFKVLNISLFIYKTNLKEASIYYNSFEVCYVLSTSGSTGIPNPVQVPWTCILPNALELIEVFKVNKCDIIASFSPVTFDPFFIDLFFTLLTGATLLFLTNHSLATEKEHVDFNFDCDIIKTVPRNATIIQITPSVFQTVQNNVLCENVRILILGGEPFPKKLPSLPNALIYNIYGITEISCWSFLHKVIPNDVKVPIGRPLNKILYKIEDNELFIGSKYRKCLVGRETPEELTEITYRKTGDLVKYDSKKNEIYILGRTDNVIKIFGTKVSMENVDKLLNSQTFLDDFCIIFNNEFQTIGWFLVYKYENTEHIKKYCISELIEFENVFSQLRDIEKPDYVFKINKLPVSSHGKRDDKVLKKILENEILNTRCQSFEQSFQNLCRDILGNFIDFNKSFFELGGNSILAMRLINLLDKSHLKCPEKLITNLLSNSSLEDSMKLVQNYSANNCLSTSGNLDGSSYNLKEKWIFNMKKCIDAPPKLLMVNGRLCVAVGSHSSQLSLVFCENGEEMWSVFLGDRIESGIAISTDENYLYTASYDQHIYCLCIKTGIIRWKTKTGGMIKSTPIIDVISNRLYCGSYDKQLYCLNAETGEILATLELKGSLLAKPVLSGNNIFSGSLSGECFCLNSETFELNWKTVLPSPVFSSPCLLSPERVLVAEVEGTLHCFNLIKGNKVWEFKCGGNIFSSLIKVDGTKLVAFGCHDRHLYLFDASDNPSLKWKRQLESAVACAPAVYQSLIACVTSCGMLNLLDFKGNVLAKLSISGDAFSSPQFYKNSIYLGCRNDNLICISVDYKLSKE